VKWVEKLFGKKVQDPIEIRFEELPSWLASGKDRLSQGRHAESVYSDIEDALLGIRKSALELEKAEPEGRFHLKMVKIASSNRENMIKQVRLLLNNINIPKTTDIRTVFEFHENAIQTLTMCLENMMKSYQYTKMVFYEDSKKVIAEVNELGRLLNQLVEPLYGSKKVLDAFDNAEKKMLNIKNMISRVEDEKKLIKELDEKIDSLKKKTELNRDNLTQLVDSEQWKQYLNSNSDLVDLENKAKKAESDIITLLVPLNKPLQRLKQMNEAGKYDLLPAIKKELHLCLIDPKSINPEFLVDVQTIIQKDTIAFNPEKRAKILEQIKFSVSKIGDFIKEYHTISYNINAKKDEIAGMNIIQEAADLRGRISSLQDNLNSAEKELEVSKKLLKSLEDGINLEKNELQQLVFVIDNRKSVIF
jgi:predicted  nucleic acid-binding Zn-ribbon protein